LSSADNTIQIALDTLDNQPIVFNKAGNDIRIGAGASSSQWGISIGNNADVGGGANIAHISIGNSSKVAGAFGIAIGDLTTAGENGIAIGKGVSAVANATVIGNGSTTQTVTFGTLNNNGSIRSTVDSAHCVELFASDGTTEHGSFGYAMAGGNYVNQAQAGDVTIRPGTGKGIILGYAEAGKSYLRLSETGVTTAKDMIVNGFTQLGDTGIGIKMKFLTATFPSMTPVHVAISHGIPNGYTNIWRVNVSVRQDSPSNMWRNSGNICSVRYDDEIVTIGTDDTTLFGQPIRIVIDYVA
jgi:hypothetical protein